MCLSLQRVKAPLLGLLVMLALALVGCHQQPASIRSVSEVGAKSTPAVARSPTPEPPPSTPDSGPFSPCGPLNMGGPELDTMRTTLAWTPDGSHLVFNHAPAVGFWDSAIWTVNAAGTRVRMVVETNPGHRDPAIYGYHADVSPDGTRIVYSSCEFPKERVEGLDFEQQRALHDYEIVLINLDGTEQQRLTANRSLEHYPVWSPDGNRIAYIANLVSQYSGHSGRGANILFTIAADGSDLQRVSPHVALAPPVWSPDGERLAFLANEGGKLPYMRILYTVTADGSELSRIASVATIARLRWHMPTLPSWSPDGEFLAFVAANEEGGTGGIYTVRFDGSGLRQVLESQEPDWSIYQVLWSPDGSELLAVTEQRLFFFQADGSGLRTFDLELARPYDDYYSGIIAAWSPDGGQIALYVPIDARNEIRPLIYTVAPDGTDQRDLVRLDDNGNLVPASPP